MRDMVSAFLLSSFVLVLMSSVHSYPMVGGNKRLQRAWAPMPLLFQRTVLPYYGQENEVDLYYPQEPYDKYRIYQMPYFIPEYLYDDDEEEQEGWYDNNADANAMFLQNLIMSQIYRDALKKENMDYDDGYVYGDVKEAPIKETKTDRDVQELKSLVGKDRRLGMENRKSKMENRWVDKRSEVTTQIPKGQEEVVMPRPATPVRSYHTRSYQPSVYDTIKKLLIEQKNEEKRQPKKRSYVLNEDSLVQQLGNLKKN